MAYNRKKFNKDLAASDSERKVIYNKTVLPNGVRVLTEEVPGIESFALGISVNAGSRDDPSELYGVSHFVEHAAFRHTSKRSSRQIASQFESLGAYTNAYTTKEFTCFYVRALKAHFRQTFELLADVTLNPLYIEKDVEKERSIILEEIKSYDDDPEELIFDYGDEMLFGTNGLGHPILGNQEAVQKIKIENLNEFHKTFYSPENVIISAAGSISHDYVVSLAMEFAGHISGTNHIPLRMPPDVITAKRITYEKPFQQSHILLSRRVEGMQSEERYIIAALNVLLGDGMSSRLYQHLRERHGLAYAIYSSLQMMTDCGILNIYAGSEKKQAARIEKLIFDELEKLVNQKIPQTELQRSKEQLKSSTIMALESMSTRMQSLVKSEFTQGFYEDISETIQLVDAITSDEIRDLCAKYFKREDWNVVIFYPE